MKLQSVAKSVLGGMAVAGASGAAMADLPTGVTDAITGIQTDGLALIAAVTAVVIAFIGPDVIIKLIKRFTRKV